jgi:hypothetical protein
MTCEPKQIAGGDVMSLAKHLEQATSRLEAARSVLRETREEVATIDGLKRRVDTLEQCVSALSEIQSYTNESIHEKLHRIATQLRMAL